jgi:hypothetical protein
MTPILCPCLTIYISFHTCLYTCLSFLHSSSLSLIVCLSFSIYFITLSYFVCTCTCLYFSFSVPPSLFTLPNLCHSVSLTFIVPVSHCMLSFSIYSIPLSYFVRASVRNSHSLFLPLSSSVIPYLSNSLSRLPFFFSSSFSLFISLLSDLFLTFLLLFSLSLITKQVERQLIEAATHRSGNS